MKTTQYEVSWTKNGIYHANIVITDKSPVEIGLHYKDQGKSVIGICIATADHMRPGKPIVRI